jgi:CheY-specific phosphatase CheX
MDRPDANLADEAARRGWEQEVQSRFREPLIEATLLTLREGAGTEVVVRAVCPPALGAEFDEVAAALYIEGGTAGALVLRFPRQTAMALAGRILSGVTDRPETALIHDCLRELANVIAGQTKTLLQRTPYHFVLATPRPLAESGDERLPPPNLEGLVIVFDSELGGFALELCLDH